MYNFLLVFYGCSCVNVNWIYQFGPLSTYSSLYQLKANWKTPFKFLARKEVD